VANGLDVNVTMLRWSRCLLNLVQQAP
jgi:hypothetical protein